MNSTRAVHPQISAAQRTAAANRTSTGEVMVQANGIETCTEAFGDPADPAIVLVNGACSSMIPYPVDLCTQLVSGGRYVIRYDPRDIGRSTAFPPGQPPCDLRDLSDDLVALLDAYGIERAHLVGASSGGMIAQHAAIRNPERVRSLTLLISSPEVPAVAHAVDEAASDKSASQPDDPFLEKVKKLANVNWLARDEALRAFVDEAHMMAGGAYTVDEAEVLTWAPLEFDRQRNILSFRFNTPIAETKTPAWRSSLLRIAAPTLVIHGTKDPVLPFATAVAVAREIPGAKLMSIEGMGHELPREAWSVIVPAILEHTS
jgi:pimeloyl-ACP methyl ester carboxylesterase